MHKYTKCADRATTPCTSCLVMLLIPWDYQKAIKRDGKLHTILMGSVLCY